MAQPSRRTVLPLPQALVFLSRAGPCLPFSLPCYSPKRRRYAVRQPERSTAHRPQPAEIRCPGRGIACQLHRAQQEDRKVQPVGDLEGAPVDERHDDERGKEQRIQHRPQRLGLIQPRRQQPRAAVQRLHHGVLGGDLLAAGAALPSLHQPACHGNQLIPAQTMAAGHAVRRRFHELLSAGQTEDQHVAEAADAQTQRRPEQQQKTGHGKSLLFAQGSPPPVRVIGIPDGQGVVSNCLGMM